MSFAPQQNWPEYRSLIESTQIEQERSRSAMETQRRYAEIYDHVQAAKNNDQPIRSLLQLEEKLALRKKLLIAWRLVLEPASE